jgi:putative transcriptional regulator
MEFDPDTQPLTAADFRRMRPVPRVKTLRRALALTQEEFARRYQIPLGTLRDWEQCRSEPDQTARAYLTAIARDPEGIQRVLSGGSAPPGAVVTSGEIHAEQDGLGDWRLHSVSRLAADQPAAFPGGPSRKQGTPVYYVLLAKTPQSSNFSFHTPSATALTLGSGFRSAERAAQLWREVTTTDTLTPDGPGLGMRPEDVSRLFDYFEECIVAAISSFQAIEAFANEPVARLLTGTMVLDRGNGPKAFDAEQIERHLSTEEKVSAVLPTLLNVHSIKGRREWDLFRSLKKVRDAATHFKSGDQHPRRADENSLYYIFLNREPSEFPMAALRVIWRLRAADGTPRWLYHLAKKHGIA